MKKYRIEWENVVTGFRGHGEWSNRKINAREIKYLDREFPYIRHWVVEREWEEGAPCE